MMKEENKRKLRLSLSTMILIGLGLGIACGIFFAEYCGFLSIIGAALYCCLLNFGYWRALL